MSDRIDGLSYKFQRLRETIRQAIDCGELTGKLPGERELARRFGVNVKTLGKAMADLTAEGVLVRQIGRGTFVSGQEHKPVRTGARRCFMWLASDRLERSFLQAMFEMASGRIESYGHHLVIEVVSPDEHGELPERCIPAGRLKSLAGIVVFSSTPSLDLLCDLQRRRIHVVLCNAGTTSMKVNRVTPDYALGGFELTEHFAQLGHDPIHLAVDDAQLGSAALQVERGYHTAMRRYHLTPPAVFCWNKAQADLLDRIISRGGGVVCFGGAISREIKARVIRSGKSIPRDLSLALLTAPGQLVAQQESVTSYDVYPDQLLDWAIRLLFEFSPMHTPREVLVPGVFNDRGSTQASSAPPPNTQPADVIV